MEVFRISLAINSNQLTASGSANRWNLDGQKVIYAGSSRSLSTLELIVHKGSIRLIKSYKVMVISIADDERLKKQIMISDLPANWREITAYSTLQQTGSDWYKSKDSLLLKVPSVVIPYEYNYVINMEHPDFTKNVNLVRTENYFWDKRLFL